MSTLASRRQFQISVGDSLDVKPYRIALGQTVDASAGFLKQRIRFLDVPGFPSGAEVAGWVMKSQSEAAYNNGGSLPSSGFSLPPPDDPSSSVVTVYEAAEVLPEISHAVSVAPLVSCIFAVAMVVIFYSIF